MPASRAVECCPRVVVKRRLHAVGELLLLLTVLGAVGVLGSVFPVAAGLAPVACAGDCDGSGTVTVEEVVLGVGITLGRAPREACVAADVDVNAIVTIDELVAAVANVFVPCDRSGTPTPPAEPGVAACRNSGGVVATEFCCPSAGEFRNTCALAGCECTPDEFEPVTVCRCGRNRCFDGAQCVGRETPTPTPTFDPLTPTRTPTVDDSGLPCISSGGTIANRVCCLGADDFPDRCRAGACACPNAVSHLVRICDCGADRCYDAHQRRCVDKATADP